jgi:outer membrane biosynthesis protein TonB
MSAAASASVPGKGLAPFYRRYELPWSPSEEMERRFRVILRNLAIAVVVLAIVITVLPKHEQVTNTDQLPERVVKLVMEPPPPPPPPPPPKPEPKPVEKTPEPVAVKPEPKPVDPRVKAAKSGLLANMDDLAALRDVDLDKLAKNQPKTTDPGDVSTVNRSLITAKAGATSGGISSPTSSGLAAGSGSLNGVHNTQQIQDPKLAAAGKGTVQGGGSGKGSRSTEEIALVFAKNKGSIDMMYVRALRDNPALQGKIVIELTISPTGDVTAVRIVSDDLNDPTFEEKLRARIMLFKFDTKDVAPMIATHTLDFFPAG